MVALVESESRRFKRRPTSRSWSESTTWRWWRKRESISRAFSRTLSHPERGTKSREEELGWELEGESEDSADWVAVLNVLCI